MRTSFYIAILLLAASAAFAAKDSCFECHSVMEGKSIIFKDDVHYKYGLSCDYCHGGDRNDDTDDSMRADRGFKVRVTRLGTPEYCGRCHSDAAFMHKYKKDQRVDQLSKYRDSVHGILLAGGEAKSAGCGDCHGVHDTRAVDDPRSRAHRSRLVETCGKCHAADSAGGKAARAMSAGSRMDPHSLKPAP